MPTTILMFGWKRLLRVELICLIKPLIIISAASKSAMTPSFSGLTVLIALHRLGLMAEGYGFAGNYVDGHDARLVKYNLVVLKNHGIGGSEVDCQLLCQE